MSDAPTVARLFVAVPLPSAISRTLILVQPPKQPGVRPLDRADLHITLHFLGGAEIAPVSQALRSVTSARFSAGLRQAGHFSIRGKKKILWVGVEPVDALIALHDKVGAALKAVGYDQEFRPYLPHITLARLAPDAPRDQVENFEKSVLPRDEIECTRFALYASETAPDGARYRILESYPLAAAA